MSTFPKCNNFNLIRLVIAMSIMYYHACVMHDGSHDSFFSEAIGILMCFFPPVPIFFVISGFLITKSYIENGGNLKHYIVSRVLRIYPALWVNLAIALMLLFFSGGIKSEGVFSIKFIVWSFFQFVCGIRFFFANTLFDLTTYRSFFPIEYLWTIPVEIGFYALVPMFYHSLACGKKKRKWLYMVWAGFVISIRFAVENSQFPEFIDQDVLLNVNHTASNILKISTLPYLWLFLFSSFLYVKWDRVQKYVKNKFLAWLPIYIVFTLSRVPERVGLNSTMCLERWTDVVGYLLMTICVLSFSCSFPSLRVLNRKVDLSYGIYLNHMQVITLFVYLGFAQSPYFLSLVFIMTLAVAMASWVLIEKPAFKLKDSLLGKKNNKADIPFINVDLSR